MHTYQLVADPTAVLRSDGLLLRDNGTPAWAMYLDWQAAGNAPAPVVVPPPAVPARVTMRQARRALLALGKLDQVNALINGLPGQQGAAARIEWEYSQEVQRHNGFVAQLAPALGMSSADLDGLFQLAGSL